MYQTFSKNGSHFQEIVRSSFHFLRHSLSSWGWLWRKREIIRICCLAKQKSNLKEKYQHKMLQKRSFGKKKILCTQVWQKGENDSFVGSKVYFSVYWYRKKVDASHNFYFIVLIADLRAVQILVAGNWYHLGPMSRGFRLFSEFKASTQKGNQVKKSGKFLGITKIPAWHYVFSKEDQVRLKMMMTIDGSKSALTSLENSLFGSNVYQWPPSPPPFYPEFSALRS